MPRTCSLDCWVSPSSFDTRARRVDQTGMAARPRWCRTVVRQRCRSHAGAMNLVAVTGAGRLGVDLEPVDALAPPGVRHHDDPDDVDDLELWVLKEAFLKASGDGLRRDPSTVGPDEPGAVWGRVEIDGYVAAWCVLQPTRGSLGSLRASSHAENSGWRASRE